MSAFDNLLTFLRVTADEFSVQEECRLYVVACKNGKDVRETFGAVEGIKNQCYLFALSGRLNRIIINRVRFSQSRKISDVKRVLVKLVVRKAGVNPVMGILNRIDIDLSLLHEFKGSP